MTLEKIHRLTKVELNIEADEQRIKYLCNPRFACFRFIALILICLTAFGNNFFRYLNQKLIFNFPATSFCYDAPGGLQDRFRDDLNMSTSKFSLLYSIYSWPSVVLTIIGGFLIDRIFGIRFGTILFLSIQTVGQFIFAVGVTINEFWLMLVGRFVFGIGAEVLTVAVNKYSVRWFFGKELSTAFGIQLCFNRIGSTANFMLIEPIYQMFQKNLHGPQIVGAVMFFALITCALSLICSVVLGKTH
jgi:MFS family permease